MKKLFMAAALVMAAISFTSCEEGKCVCTGIKGNGGAILDFLQQGGYTDDMACQEIRSRYTDAKVITCLPGKTIEDLKDE